MDIGLIIQLAMLIGTAVSVGIMALLAYRKGKTDEQSAQDKRELENAKRIEEIRTRPKPSPSSVRDKLRDGKF